MTTDSFPDLLRIAAATDRWPSGLSLGDAVRAVPRLEELPVEPGDRILVRADLDLPIEDGKVVDESRIDACLPTVRWCIENRLRTVLFGHIGRNQRQSLQPVANAWSRRIGTRVELIHDWFDEVNCRVNREAIDAVTRLDPGSVLMLENCRRYSFETAGWGKTESELVDLATRWRSVAREIAGTLASVEILECIAASNFDFSSSVLPFLMKDVRLGKFMRMEMLERVSLAMACDILVMSGLKANKLDDLEQIINARPVQLVIVGGALAMPLLKARGEATGVDFELGRVGTDSSLPSYVPAERIAQAAKIITACAEAGVELLLPSDFVLQDGRICSDVPVDGTQLDIGPQSVVQMETAIQGAMVAARHPLTAFVNGAVGMYEDERYSSGTQSVVQVMMRLRRQGLRVFVGGGDGRAAFERFGDLSAVDYAFTSGGTILKLLAGKSVAYLNAAYLANSAKQGT